MSRAGALAAGVVTGAGLLELARRLPPAARAPWQRSNHAEEAVTLLEGPAAVSAAVVGLLMGPGPRGGAAVAVLVPGILGGVDDLFGDTGTKGLRGHLGALRAGRVTTGAAKIGGLGATALVCALLERSERDPLGLLVTDTVLVAGTANLVNLLDLRPGRALKATTAVGALLLLPVASRPLGAAVVGASVGVLPRDLAGKSMLGDCGANALGGLLGLALVRGLGPRSRLGAAALVTGLTLLSERVSFTRVIESTPVLRRIDAWGRAR